MKQIKISKLELFMIYKDIKKNICQHLEEYPPVKDLPSILATLSQNNQLFVFSSNKKEAINAYLKKYKIDEYFSGIFEDNSYFGKHVGLQKIVINQRLDPNNVYYIGDETRDIAASKKAGIKSIAVTWGYAGDIPLSDAKPDYLS